MMTQQSTQNTSAESGQEIRPFATFLLEHNKGRTNAELGAALREVAAAVVETGKAGRLQLVLDVKPAPADGAVSVVDRITTKVPRLDRKSSIFYLDDGDNLVRTDPHQHSIPFEG